MDQKIRTFNERAGVGTVANTESDAVWYNWPFQPWNEHQVAGWGFWLAIVGLILTLGGFYLTFYQLRKTRSAAEAVENKVKEVQAALVRYDVANDVARASVALSAARNYARAGLWANVADSYEVCRSGLHAIKDDSSDLSSEQRQEIERAIRYIDSLCKRIENGLEKGKVPDKAKTISVMRNHAALIEQTRRTIEKGVVQ